MPKEVQFRRGNTNQNNNFKGAEGEISINLDSRSIRVHNGITTGGFELARSDLSNATGITSISVSGIVSSTSFNGVNANFTGIVTSPSFVGNLTGIASTATNAIQLRTTRTFEITGDIVASPQNFNGTQNISFASSIQPNTVGLGTHTYGDYVKNITGTSGEIEISVTSGEGVSPQIGLPNDVTISNDLTINNDLKKVNNVYSTGIITATKLSATDVDVSGINISSGNIYLSGIVTASQFSTGSESIGINTNTIFGPAVMFIDPSTVGDNTGIVRIKGDFYVDGTQTIINSTNLEVNDLKIGIAGTTSDLVALDGAGIGIGSTSIEKTFIWEYITSSLKSSENLNVASGKTYKINGTDVLTSNSLGSGIVNSSLTSVGTLNQLNVSGIATASSFIPSSGYIKAPDGTNSFYIYSGTGNVSFQGTIGASQINNASGNKVIGFAGTDIKFENNAYVSGITTTSTLNVGTGGTVITTTSSGLVGIKTTNPTQALDVVGNINASGTVTANSDLRLKENIKTISNSLEKVLSLRGVEYDKIDTGDHQIGLIAQEVEKIIPEVVYGNEIKSVAYANLVGLLIEAIKEQNQRIDELEKRLGEL